MNILRALQRPEYFYHPGQIWRRIRRHAVLAKEGVRLAWGLPIRINPTCHTGVDILNLGLFDRIVPETICRLLGAGEWALDVGANIGQNASIMALVAGPRGHVVAFEPHPTLWQTLSQNVVSWCTYDLATIQLAQKGLSSRAGKAYLYEGDDFPGNQGSASLEAPPIVARKHEIELTTLDEFLPEDAAIGLAKLDVEGHEHDVLQGAEKLLNTGRLRDLIFEDYQLHQPSCVTQRLEAAGYTVLTLYAPWYKPCFMPYQDFIQHTPKGFFSYNYLATLDVDRVRARFRRSGWQCLRLRVRARMEQEATRLAETGESQ
jgi:FkbM family methyltransferase